MTDYQCFYVPGEGNIIDIAKLNDAGQRVSQIHGQTLEELRARHPKAEMGSLNAWVAEEEKRLISEPQEITKEQWWEALECLPPEGWRNCGGAESFKMSEYYSGRITSIYVRLGDRYYTFHDVANLPHHDCVAKVRAALPQED